MRRWWGRRSKRRPRRWPAPPARRATSASPRRPPTSSTTSPCCCARAASVLPTPKRSSLPGVAESTHNLVPVCETFIEDCETPVSAFLKLRGSGPAFLLESAEQGQRVGRWSFIGYKPRSVIRWNLADGGDPYALAAAEIAQFRQAPVEEPIPFTGGAVGFFGYDCVRAVERLPDVNPDPVGLPDMALMLSDVIVAFDHSSTRSRSSPTPTWTRTRPPTSARGRRSARSASGSPARCRGRRPWRARSRSSSPTCH